MVPRTLLTLIFALVFAFCEASAPEALQSREGAGAASSEQSNSEDVLEERSIAPDFSLPDINDSTFTLSSLRGKYVVLDFWGTWCGWCVKSMPKMKEAYEQHKDKMEIVGVDCGDATARWKAAVQVLKLPWINVQVGRDNSVSRLYQVKGFPTKVIIDPEGRILKIITGEDQRFYTVLDKLLK